MPNIRPHGEVRGLWKKFVHALRVAVGQQLPEHRHQDQFLRVRERALDLAESDAVADDIEMGYRKAVASGNSPLPAADAVDVVVVELESFPLAVQVHDAEAKAGTARAGAGKRLRSAAKTILGSVGDLFSLTDVGKGAITVSKEVLDLVDGD